MTAPTPPTPASLPPGEAPDPRHAVPLPSTGYVWRDRPADARPGATPVLGVHGYGQDVAGWLAWLRTVVPAATPLLGPEGPNSFYRRARTPGGAAAGGVGYGWLADPRREPAERRNDALLDAALALEGATPAVLVGYSQGVGVATHYAVGHRARVRALVGLAGGVPTAWRGRLGALAGLPVLWVTGRADVAYPPPYEADLLAILRAAGADLEHVELDADHALLEAAAPRVRAWLGALLGAG